MSFLVVKFITVLHIFDFNLFFLQSEHCFIFTSATFVLELVFQITNYSNFIFNVVTLCINSSIPYIILNFCNV